MPQKTPPDWCSTNGHSAKTFVQRYRLRLRSLLLLTMLGVIAVCDRKLNGTAVGSVLYTGGAIMILTSALGRFWCYVYNSGARTKTVITQGPYSLCRNPIYLCSIMATVGAGLLSQSIVLAALFGFTALPFYNHIINGEEAKMKQIHGLEFLRYLERTPKYFPRFAQVSPGNLAHVPGPILMRKLPKLAALGLIFPAIEICNQLSRFLQLNLIAVL